jgi:exopolyphosphatase/guanosine-5'-triphosphate,3'-diphosphate pyrophosphatase
MRLAAIDIGTNTLRMMVAEREGKSVRPLARYQRIVGMGRRLRDTGGIGEREFREAVEALRGFRREMDLLGVDSYRSCGTACLREAVNGERFLAAARELGVSTEVISPAEEGRLVWEGIRGTIPLRRGDIVMDVGGGSTEFTSGPGKGESVSLPVGVVVLSTLLPLSDPPLAWEWRALTHYAKARIGDGTSMFGRGRKRRLIGTAGTFTTVLALAKRMTRYEPERINGARLSKETAIRWAKRLSVMTDAGRLRLPGMEKGRERYMVPGMGLSAAALDRFGADGLTVSDAGMLEGIIAGIGAENMKTSNPQGEDI